MPSVKSLSDGRCALYPIYDLPKKHQETIIRKFGDLEILKLKKLVESGLKITATNKQFINQYSYNNQFLPATVAQQYIQATAYLELLSTDYSQFGFKNEKQFITAVIPLVKAFNISLPSTYRTLKRKVQDYKNNGTEAVISKKYGNLNKAKITNQISAFIIAQYAQPNILITASDLHKIYEGKRHQNGWPELSQKSIFNHLMKPANKRLWAMGKFGVKSDAYKGQFQHHLALSKASQSDYLYVIDGTKIDFWYQNENGIASSLKMNVVIDGHSEVILGIHFSESEKIEDHKATLYNSLKFSGTKPHQVLYDNQGGHKSKEMQNIYDQVVATGGTHYPARAYNSQAKQIEQMFNRFQQRILRKFWFSDGQSITAKKAANQINAEFLLEHRHRLPFKADILALEDVIVSLWNNANYPGSSESRIERYNAGKVEEIETADQRMLVNLFYTQKERKITYHRGGLITTINKQEYCYEVYDSEQVDINFRRHYVGQQFIVKYDPTALDHIYLFLPSGNDDLKLVAKATQKNIHTQVLADQTEGSKEAWYTDFSIRDQEQEADEKALALVRAQAGISPEDLFQDELDIFRKMGALAPKNKRSDADSDTNSLLNQL